MLTKLRPFLPGEKAKMLFVAAFIGTMSGFAIILFRETVHFVQKIILGHGAELLGVHSGDWHRFLLPLLPIAGVTLLIPLSLAFPG